MSLMVGSVFGLVVSVFIILTGDQSARLMANHQPMKFAAMENLYEGTRKAPLVVFGLLKKNATEPLEKEDFAMRVAIPNFLSSMAFLNADAYVPGIKDLAGGNAEHSIMSVNEKIDHGKTAVQALKDYNIAKKEKDSARMNEALVILNANYKYFGYGYLTDANQAIPSIKSTFYSFRLIVYLEYGLSFSSSSL